MKLVVIYGPPASGKLTIAKKLSKLTTLKLFHNHIVNDALAEILDNTKDSYWDAGDDVKIKIIETAAKQKIKGIIFTLMRAKDKKGVYKDGKFAKRLKNAVEKNRGKVYFVRLICDQKEILRRVKKRSRKKFNKFKSPEQVTKFMKRFDVHASFNFRNQLEINNTNVSAKEVAKQIKKHYRL